MTGTEPSTSASTPGRRPRRIALIAGATALAAGAGAAPLLTGGEPASALPNGSSVTVVIQTAGGPLAGDLGTDFTATAYAWSAAAPKTKSGKASIGDLTFTHPIGPGSISLATALRTNQPLTKVTVSVLPSGPRPRPEFTYDLATCTVVDIADTYSAGSSAEQVKVRCASVVLTSTPTKPDGTAGTTTQVQLP